MNCWKRSYTQSAAKPVSNPEGSEVIESTIRGCSSNKEAGRVEDASQEAAGAIVGEDMTHSYMQVVST